MCHLVILFTTVHPWRVSTGQINMQQQLSPRQSPKSCPMWALSSALQKVHLTDLSSMSRFLCLVAALPIRLWRSDSSTLWLRSLWSFKATLPRHPKSHCLSEVIRPPISLRRLSRRSAGPLGFWYLGSSSNSILDLTFQSRAHSHNMVANQGRSHIRAMHSMEDGASERKAMKTLLVNSPQSLPHSLREPTGLGEWGQSSTDTLAR